MAQNQKEIISMINEGAKKVPLLLGVLYLLGFVISLIHYAKFGLLSIDFISTQYILIGTLFLLFCIVSLFIISFAKWCKVSTESWCNKHQIKQAKMAGWVVYFLLGMFLTFSVELINDLALIFYKIDIIGYGGSRWAIALLASSLIFIPVIWGGALRIFIGSKNNESSNKGFLYLCFVGSFIFAFVFIYTTQLYSKIPTSIGGGKEGEIVLLIKEKDCDKNFREMLCMTDSLSFRTSKLILIKETNTDYYVEIPDSVKVANVPKAVISCALLTQ